MNSLDPGGNIHRGRPRWQVRLRTRLVANVAAAFYVWRVTNRRTLMDIGELKRTTGMSGHVDHVGIAVSDLDEAVKLYKGMLGLTLEHVEEVAREKIRVAFLRLNAESDIGHVELLEPMDPDCNIGRFIAKKGPGLHHVAFAATDIGMAMDRCREAGLRLLNEEPLDGAHGKRIVFLHPKDTGGVLVEICSD
jgi:methylmalonyl-CoA epimerase